MAARLLVRHQRRPDLIRIEIVAALIEQALRIGFHQARRETLSDQSALPVTTVRVETVTDDWLALANDIGDDGDEARRHFGEIDIGVADRGGDRFCNFADLDDADGHGFSFRQVVRLSRHGSAMPKISVQDSVLSRKYGSTGPWTLIVSGLP